MKVAPIALLAAIGIAADAAKIRASESGQTSPAATYTLRIAPQDLGSALQELARQSGSQIIFFSRVTAGLTTEGLDGKYTLPEAMGRLLADSGLSSHQLSERTFEVRPIPGVESSAASETPSSPIEGPEIPQKGLPEILVTGTRGNLNLDIERTENDVLPYVVFDSEQIQQSGASTVEEFLKYRLPMNTLQQAFGQNPGSLLGARSQVNLRGFGSNQTLILIDGRRTSNVVINSTLQQQDLNGIALRTVERIEVLPTSAGGIYGGDATGGVINVILRRDYHGAELAIGYENVFDGEARMANVSLTGGFSLESGKTNVSMSAFWSEADLLRRQDRIFVRQYRDRAFAHSPELWQPPALAPLGYTTNIRSTGGSLILDDGTALDSLFTSVPVGYSGPASDGGAALVANAGRYNFDPADSGQNLNAFGGDRVTLLNLPSLESINATVRREFGSSLHAFLDASASNSTSRASFNGLTSIFTLPANAANNPFQQGIEVLVPVPSRDLTGEHRSSDRRVVAGLISRLPWRWTGELDYVWHKSGIRRVARQFTRTGSAAALSAAVRGDPNFNPLRDTNIHPLDFSPYMGDWYYGPFETTTRDVTLLLGGPVGSLPGGSPVLSVRLEHRDVTFGAGRSVRGAGSAPESIFPKTSQTVSSALTEIRLPLARQLEAQISARRDEYSIRGSQTVFNPGPTTPIASTATASRLHSTNPAVGMRWMPVEDVALRASYGTGFLPPDVTQLAVRSISPTSAYANLPDPRRGNQPIGQVMVRLGGNPDLKPEESDSRSAGIVFTPRWAQGMRFSLDYTHIDRSDRIVLYPFDEERLINEEAQFPGRISRGQPTAAEVAMGWSGPITLIDDTLLNFARAKTEAYDVQFDYKLETERSGLIDLHAIGTWNRYNITQTRAGEPVIDNVGFSGGVLEYKINGGVTWTHRSLTLGWNTQYFDSYFTYPALAAPLTTSEIANRARLVEIQGGLKVDSQMYHDAFAKYRIARLNDSELTFGIRNVFNTRPPRDQQSYSTYGDPRLASYYLGFRMSFD